MIEKEISKKILTIGNQSVNPDGGISYVLYCYREFVFPHFYNIVNFKRGRFFYKLAIAMWAYVRELFMLAFNRKIKIVHVHTASGIAFKRSSYYISLARAMGKKVIIHIHSGRFNEYWEANKKYVDSVLSKCDIVVALSEDLKNFYKSQGCNKAIVINNIIVPPTEKGTHYNDDKIHLLFLGVIMKAKGIYDLVDVLHEHKEEFIDKIILHVGGNAEVDTLNRMIDELELHDIVKFEGWLSGDAKNEALSLCDVFILPSYTEGVPISILEALSYGKYIIATNVGGIPDIVDEKSGVLMPPQDKESLYRALNNLIENKEYKNNIPYRIEKSTNYMPDEVGRQLESLYVKLLNSQTNL